MNRPHLTAKRIEQLVALAENVSSCTCMKHRNRVAAACRFIRSLDRWKKVQKSRT